MITFRGPVNCLLSGIAGLAILALVPIDRPAHAQTKATIVVEPVPNGISEITVVKSQVVLRDKQGVYHAVTLKNGTLDLIPTSAKPSSPARRPNMLPDGVVTTGTKNIRAAWLANPTRRYGHGVLGDAIEAGGFGVELADGTVQSYTLPQNAVFEDRFARLVDLNQDGEDEILVIKSFLDRGASIALFKSNAGGLIPVAESEPIGRANRWLNIVGAADFDGDGRIEVAVVITPHIGGTLSLYELRNGKLVEDGAASGFSNHTIGSRELGWSVILDVNNDGVEDMVVPDTIRQRLRAVTFAGGRFKELSRARVNGRLASAIVTADLNQDGRKEVIYGSRGGSLNIIRFMP